MTGYALRQIQRGKSHVDCKPMKGDLRAVLEISVDDDSGRRTYRAACTTTHEIVYVLHAFQKKALTGAGTPKRELDLIRRRLRTAQERVEKRHGEDRP